MQNLQQKYTYKRTVIFEPATIGSGQTTSNIVDLGGAQLRAVLIPAAWTTCDMTFFPSIVSSQDISYLGYNLQNFDGVNKAILTVPGVNPLDWIPFYAHWFDTPPYIKLVCSVAQGAQRTVLLALEPIYQGIHG